MIKSLKLIIRYSNLTIPEDYHFTKFFLIYYIMLHVTEETCRKIWLQLRRSYANEKRQQKQNPGARTTRNCKYRRYFDAMKFLDGVMEEEFARYVCHIVTESMCYE